MSKLNFMQETDFNTDWPLIKAGSQKSHLLPLSTLPLGCEWSAWNCIHGTNLYVNRQPFKVVKYTIMSC